MTSPTLEERELAQLYSTYYPRKSVNTVDLVSSAKRSVGLVARVNRWWSGTDNQGQYSVSSGQSILDVGCGSGLSLLEAQALGARAYGIEADPNVQRIADELGLNIHIGSLHDHPFPEVFFDLIVLNQVIEHIPEPGLALDVLKSRLKPGGRIVLVFPNRSSLWRRLSGGKWINWHVPYHLHHFDANGFSVFAQRHGFRVIGLRTITPNIWTILQIQAWRNKAEPTVASSIWTVKSIDSSREKNGNEIPSRLFIPVRVVRSISRRMVFFGLSVLNRIIDLLRQGDSIIVEIQPE